MPTRDQFHHAVERLLELDPGSLKGDELLESFDWDSMAVVMFIAMADKNYDIAVSPSNVRDAKSLADLFAILSK